MTLAFDRWGQTFGRPIVLLHGWCGERAQMKGLGDAFAPDHPVYAPDLPGHGQSARLENPAFVHYAEAVVAFLEVQNLRNVVLVGHSMGGVLSVMASALTDRITLVVNLDGALPLTDAGRAVYKDLFEKVAADGFRPTVEAFVRRAFFLPSESGPVMENLISGMMKLPADLGEALLKQFPTLDAPAILNAGKSPLLYIGSARPRFDEDAVRSIRPDTHFAQVGASGHFLQVFAIPAVAVTVRNYI